MRDVILIARPAMGRILTAARFRTLIGLQQESRLLHTASRSSLHAAKLTASKAQSRPSLAKAWR